MGAMTVFSVLWASGPLDDRSKESSSSIANAAGGSTASIQAAVDANQLQQLCQLDLRRPLHDAAPVAPPPLPPTAPPVPLNIHLSGTIVEPGHSQAIIVMPDGTEQLKNVGDEAGNARIDEIHDGGITVEYSGQQILLTVPKEGAN